MLTKKETVKEEGKAKAILGGLGLSEKAFV